QLLNDKGLANPLPAAAVRLLALRKPEGAIETLLNYLPFVEDEVVMGEVQSALVTLASHSLEQSGKVDKALLAALESRLPLRRAVAAETLALSGLEESRPNLHKLLADPDLAMVRLRTALALAGVGEKPAVPVLIALLADLPLNSAVQIEDYLRFVAKDTSPE